MAELRVFFRGLSLFVRRKQTDDGTMALLVRGSDAHGHLPMMQWNGQSPRTVDPFRCRLHFEWITGSQSNPAYEAMTGEVAPIPGDPWSNREAGAGKFVPTSREDARAFNWIPDLGDFAGAKLPAEYLSPQPDAAINAQVQLGGGVIGTAALAHEVPPSNPQAHQSAQLVSWPHATLPRAQQALAEEVIWRVAHDGAVGIQVRVASLDTGKDDTTFPIFPPDTDGIVEIVLSNLPFPIPGPMAPRTCGHHFVHFLDLLQPAPGGNHPYPCPDFFKGGAQIEPWTGNGPTNSNVGRPDIFGKTFPVQPSVHFMTPFAPPLCAPGCCEE